MYSFADDFIQPKVVECNNQTITVKGMPFWFTFCADKWKLAGTNIKLIDYIGTPQIGMLYFNKPVQVNIGSHINLVRIKTFAIF